MKGKNFYIPFFSIVILLTTIFSLYIIALNPEVLLKRGVIAFVIVQLIAGFIIEIFVKKTKADQNAFPHSIIILIVLIIISIINLSAGFALNEHEVFYNQVNQLSNTFIKSLLMVKKHDQYGQLPAAFGILAALASYLYGRYLFITRDRSLS